MSKKVLIPSEMLEPIITKTIGEIMEHFALGMWTYEQMETRIFALNHFVDNCGAIHCSLAIGNTLGMIWKFKDKQEELREMLKKTLVEHIEEGG